MKNKLMCWGEKILTTEEAEVLRDYLADEIGLNHLAMEDPSFTSDAIAAHKRALYVAKEVFS